MIRETCTNKSIIILGSILFSPPGVCVVLIHSQQRAIKPIRIIYEILQKPVLDLNIEIEKKKISQISFTHSNRRN